MRSGAVLGALLTGVLLYLCPVTALAARGVPLVLAEEGGAQPASALRQRYIELAKRKQRAERLASALRFESDLSAKRKTYLVLDLSTRTFEFKVRGRVFKAVPLDRIEVSRAGRPAEPDDLAGRAFLLELKEGKGVETESITLKSLTPEEAARAGATEVEDVGASAEQGEIAEGAPKSEESSKTAGTGAPPASQKMAGVAGGAIPPDPPPRYHLGFDGHLSIWVDAEESPAPSAAGYERLLRVAKAIGRLFSRSGAEPEEMRVTLHTTLDRGRQLYRQLICGQQLLIVP